MKMFDQPIPQRGLMGFLLSMLLLVGCLPIQPISRTAVPNASAATGQAAAIVLTWEGAPLGEGPTCAHLTVDELTQFDHWLYSNETLYVDNNYLAGMGSTPVPADEAAAIERWATMLYARLVEGSNSVGTEMDLTTWSAYEADSGFVIYYPPTLYTVDVLPGRADSPFSGVILFTPTDALNSREPLAASYRLSILAHVASKAYSLSDGATFLANGQLLSYVPTLLDGRTITRTDLAGAPAVRVADLPVGQAGVAIQLMAIRADIVYELVVEPAQVSSGNVAADQANLALVEQMMQTFRFTK